MEEESKVGKVSGSLPAMGGATIVSAIAGGPIAALLPLLLSTIASGRHKKRVESALEEIQAHLGKLGDDIKNISDAQYKFINESVLTILQSPDDKKIEYLKAGIRNVSATDRLNLHEATRISRALRDITVEELTFLIECKGKTVVFHENPVEGSINVSKLEYDGERAIGLISLGLLTKEKAEGMWDDDGVYVFTSISKKLLEIIL